MDITGIVTTTRVCLFRSERRALSTNCSNCPQGDRRMRLQTVGKFIIIRQVKWDEICDNYEGLTLKI